MDKFRHLSQLKASELKRFNSDNCLRLDPCQMPNKHALRVAWMIDFFFHLQIQIFWYFWYSWIDHLHIERSTMAKHSYIGVLTSGRNKFVIVALEIFFEWLTNTLWHWKLCQSLSSNGPRCLAVLSWQFDISTYGWWISVKRNVHSQHFKLLKRHTANQSGFMQ